MTAGDLTPNMIGHQKVSLIYDEARIEGLLTDILVHTQPERYTSRQDPDLRTSYVVTLSIQVGQILIKEIPLDHEVRMIG